jgi:hypothetical protein
MSRTTRKSKPRSPGNLCVREPARGVHPILPIGLHLGEAISRIHTGGSVGALFGVPV